MAVLVRASPGKEAFRASSSAPLSPGSEVCIFFRSRDATKTNGNILYDLGRGVAWTPLTHNSKGGETNLFNTSLTMW